LRYWVTQFHVDGFRFDLGVTLGREPHGFDPGAGFFDALRQDPILSRVKLISEPWDIGPGGYQLGQHPPGFAEWNDRFRDTVRRFWRGDAGQRSDLAARIAGSSDLFDRRSRRPWSSVNYIASHDGFTLDDIVSYAQKHNEANGEDNQDGHNENYSANWGAEGPTDDPAILETRRHVARAMLATVFLSHGTPMLLGGDEFGRTQRGNSNAYCQDNEISWVDWQLAAENNVLTTFVARLIGIRRRFSVLRSRNFLHGKDEPAPGVRDIEWFDAKGEIIPEESWNNGEERILAVRRAAPQDDGTIPILNLLLNPTAEAMRFRLPPPPLPTRILIDSAAPDAAERDIEGNEIEVAGRSAVLTVSVYKPEQS
jgi:glycogen operon protein